MNPEVTAAIIAASVSVLTLIGTLAAQYFGRRATSRDTQKALEEQREQLDRTLAEHRTRTLNERFATAAEQLGSDRAAVQLAGVYALAGLADDWEANRQRCVDVLCAYLRLLHDPDPGDDAKADKRSAYVASREVRHTVIRLIGDHLRPGAAVCWQGLNLDFTGAVFDGGDFTGAIFSGGVVRFDGASFAGGMVSFDRAQFSGGEVLFVNAAFTGGEVSFVNAGFTGGEVSFVNARFCGGTVDFTGAKFSRRAIDFRSAKFRGGKISFSGAGFSGSTVSFYEAEFSGGMIDLGGAGFSDGTVSFAYAEFSGSEVSFGVATLGGALGFLLAEYSGGAEFTGGEVDFTGAKFSSGAVSFPSAKFTGSDVSFMGAKFSGAEVDFRDVRDWSNPPAFPWTHTPPPGVKLPRRGSAELDRSPIKARRRAAARHRACRGPGGAVELSRLSRDAGRS